MGYDFRPSTFFEHAISFASQGRGVFQIGVAPPFMVSKETPWPEVLSKGIMAKGFSLPGRQLGTYPEFSYVGPTTKHAYGLIFPDIDVEFFMMGKTSADASNIYNTFLVWIDRIAGPESPHPQSAYPIDPFLVRYYEDYISTAQGTVFSPAGNPISRIVFSEIYPVAISPVQTSWESPDAPVTFTVTFTYFYASTSGT